MRVLVTGSTGFVGGAICQALAASSFTVRAFHRQSSNLTLLKDLEVEHAIGDLTQPESIRAAMQDVDVVIHSAAMMGEGSQQGKMYTVTVEGTRNMLETALEFGVKRFIHTSSVAALGIPLPGNNHQQPDKALWMDENHSWNYRSDYYPYGYSKYLAELEVQKAVSMGLQAVILNPTVVIGAGDIYRKSSSIIVKLAKKHVPFIPTGGLNVIHIQDVVAGHLAAIEHGRTGERYILGATNLTAAEFVQKIGDYLNISAPRLLVPGSVIRKAANPLKWLYPLLNLPVPIELIRLAGYGFYYSNKKAIQELHIPAPLGIDEAIKDTCEWFRAIKAI
jgi:dihydroflavonol-4-reductase